MICLVVFLMVIQIFNNEFVNSRFRNKKWWNQNDRSKIKFEYKLGGFNTCKLVPDITDYKLEFMTKKFKTADPIWRTEIIENIYIFE